MEISFASKKEDELEDEGDKKIEFAKKFDPNLGQEKKSPAQSSDSKSAIEDDIDGLEMKEAPADNFFTKLIAKLKGSGTRGNWGKDDVLEVNLVKSEIVKYFDWQKGILLLLLFVFLSMSIISLAYWGISWWGTKKQYTQNPVYIQSYYKINKEIKDREGEIDDVLAFKHRLDIANFLLARHVYWSSFFDFLEDNTLSNVFFSSFSGDINGNYHLSATTNNFDAINAQTKKFLNNPYVRGATVESGTIAGEKGRVTVSFDLTLTLDPKIFLKK
jgi:hypothetical protein